MNESGLQDLLGSHASGSLLLLGLVWLLSRCEARVTLWLQQRAAGNTLRSRAHRVTTGLR